MHTSPEPLVRYSAREMPLAKDTRGALKCSRAEPGHIAHRRLAPKQTPAYRLADQRALPARYHIAGLLHFRSGVLHFRLGYGLFIGPLDPEDEGKARAHSVPLR